MRLDLHTHSKYSSDGRHTIRTIVKRARKIGLDGIAVTDHNSIRSHIWLDRLKGEGLLLVPGVEVSSSQGHVLGYGIRDEVPKGLSVQETIDRIIEVGGLPVAAHPYRRVTGIGERAVLDCGFKVVEVFNAKSLPRGNTRSCELAMSIGASVTGGSDAHTTKEIGKGFTDVPDGIETVDQLIEAIRKGESEAGGFPASMKKVVEKTTGNVIKFVKRGMKRM